LAPRHPKFILLQSFRAPLPFNRNYPLPYHHEDLPARLHCGSRDHGRRPGKWFQPGPHPRLRRRCSSAISCSQVLITPQKTCLGDINSLGSEIGCGQFDYSCICGNKDFISAVSCCVSKKCSPADQKGGCPLLRFHSMLTKR
jgi:CFEM domain